MEVNLAIVIEVRLYTSDPLVPIKGEIFRES